MWNSLCLMAAALVGASCQRTLQVLANGNSGGDPGTLGPSSVFVDHEAITPAVETCPPCTCGAPGKKLGIVGGNSTYVDQYPWMALLLYNGHFFCGGSLINDKYVVTAAHCVEGKKRKYMKVRLLEYDRSTTREIKSREFIVLDVIVHEKYVSVTYGNDITLLRLDTVGVIFSAESKIHPVCLPTKGESFAGYQGVVIGWGQTSNYGYTSVVLQQADLPIISNDECSALYSDVQDNITDNMMCAGYHDGRKNACHGDSGGPLQIIRNASYHIVGIFSGYEIACSGTKYPNIYTRVNNYLDWLADKTKDACPCNNVYDPSKNNE